MTAASLTTEQLRLLVGRLHGSWRAAAPLPTGLRHLASRRGGALDRFAQDAAEALERGETLAAVVERHRERLPASFVALVRAAETGGDAAGVFAALARSLAQVAGLRQELVVALAYPALLVAMALGLLGLCVGHLWPVTASALRDFGAADGPWQRTVGWLAPTGPLWYAAAALVLLGCLTLPLSGRDARWVRHRWARVLVGWWPGVRRLYRDATLAGFVEILAVLIARRVPLPEALTLAAEAVEEPALKLRTARLAAAVAAGADPATAMHAIGDWPPRLRWALSLRSGPDDLAADLHRLAESYREAAAEEMQRVQTVLPAVMVAAVGLTVVLGFGLLYVLPLTALFENLSLPLTD